MGIDLLPAKTRRQGRVKTAADSSCRVTILEKGHGNCRPPDRDAAFSTRPKRLRQLPGIRTDTHRPSSGADLSFMDNRELLYDGKESALKPPSVFFG